MLFLHKAFVVICWIRIMLELEIISHETFVVVGNPQSFFQVSWYTVSVYRFSKGFSSLCLLTE